MKKTYIILLSSCMALTACVEENALPSTGSPSEVKNEHAIPVDRAIDNMYSFIGKVYGTTRSAGFAIESIETVKAVQIMPTTRAADGTAIEDVLYVVNYEDEGGFAILAADDRLPDEVIAVSGSGQMPLNAFDRIIISEPSEFTSANDSLYCVEDDDYYLGASSDFIAGMTANYVTSNFDYREPCYDDYNDEDPTPGQSGTAAADYDSGWIVDNNIPAKLKTKWHQRTPFNDQCPYVYTLQGMAGINYHHLVEYDQHPKTYSNYVLDRDQTVAGCVAIAVAQILAYHKYPALDTIIPSDTLTWDDLTMETDSTYFELPPEAYNPSVARLIHTIGAGCNMEYGFGWTTSSFSTPRRAKNYMKDIGYASAHRYVGYDKDVVFNMLLDDCPVFIGAISNTVDGHAWVIDGCIKQHRTTGLIGNDNIYNTKTERQVHVHCNWGWSDGECNGYYTSGVFDLTKPLTIEGDSTNMTHNFDHWFRMITYNKPN